MKILKHSLILISILFLSLSLQSASIMKILPLPGYWDGYYASRMTFDGENLWIGDDYDGMIRCIDTANGNVIDSFSSEMGNIYGVEFDGENFWVANDDIYGPYYFLIFDSIGTLIDSLVNPVASRYLGGFAFQDSCIWVAMYYPNTQPNLFKVDTSTLTKIDSISSPGLQPIGFTWDGTYLWVAMDDNDGDPERVYKLESTNGNILDSFDIPTTRPRGLAWDGEFLWLIAKHPDSLKGRLYKYDVEAGMPELQLATHYHDYGIIPLGDSSLWNLDYSNIGDENLFIDSMIITGTGFSTKKAFPETLLPDSSSSVEIKFQPEHYAMHTGTLYVYSNDPMNPADYVHLQGEGYSSFQDIVVPDSSHNFGQLWKKAKSYWYLTIQNMGLLNLTIDSIKLTGTYYHYNDTTPFVIPAYSDVKQKIWYIPGVTGTHYDTVNIFSDDPYEPVVNVKLIGEGIDMSFDSSGTAIWTYNAEGGVWEHIRSLKVLPDIDYDGYDEIIAVSENDTLYCIYGNSYSTGLTAWTFTDDPCWTERGLIPIEDIDGDSISDIILGTIWGSRRVYTISGVDGSVIWFYDTHEYGDGGWVYEVSPFVDITGDSIIEVLAAAGNDGSNTGPRRIFCLNGETGVKEWEKQLSDYTGSGAQMITDINGDNIPEVAASSLNGTPSAYNVYLLDGSNGSQEWVKNIGTGAVWTVIPGCDANSDDTVDIIAGYYGGVCALNTLNGDIIWNNPTSGSVIELTKISDINGNGSPEVIPQGAAVPVLKTIDTETGNTIWSKSLADDIYCVTDISDLTGDGISELAAGTGYSNNYVYLIDGSDGNILHYLPMGSPVESINRFNDITDDGFDEIIVGLRDGNIKLLPTGNWSGIEERNIDIESGYLTVRRITTGDILIKYRIPGGMNSDIKLIDIQGRVLFEREIEKIKTGIININTNNIPSGIYHILMETSSDIYKDKIILIK